MKYGFIREHCQRFPVARLCRVLGVSRSGFHGWLVRPESARAQSDRRLLTDIHQVHIEHREAYGGVKTWRIKGARPLWN